MLRQEDPVHADTLFEQALTILEQRPKKNATRIAELLNDLGLRLEEDDPARSRALLGKSIRLHRDNLGHQHPATLPAMNNLAAILHYHGEADAAEPLFREIVDARREVLPSGSVAIAYTLYRLGRVALDLGRPAEAEQHLSEAADILDAHLPRDDTRVLLSRHYLAISVSRLGRAPAARSILQDNLTRIRDRFGAEDSEMALTRSALRSLQKPPDPVPSP